VVTKLTQLHLFSLRFSVVHKTEVIKNNLNPFWRSFKISAQALCNGDYQRYWNIYNFNKNREPNLTEKRNVEMLRVYTSL